MSELKQARRQPLCNRNWFRHCERSAAIQLVKKALVIKNTGLPRRCASRNDSGFRFAA
jgi:hypothetical protein